MESPSITIEELQNVRVIYIRFRGTYIEFRKNSRRLFNQIFTYAKENNLIIENVSKVLTIYHDNPFITNEKDTRTSIAMTVPLDAKFQETNEITSMIISGKYGVGHFHLSPSEYGEAWKYMYENWLFIGSEKPRDSFPFEMYITEPPKRFKDKSYTDIYIPID
jgi:AraC family transcriptional regulator